LLAREQPHLLPLFDEYAAAIARGEAVPTDLDRLADGRVFSRALINATSDLKGLLGLILTFTSAITAHFTFRHVLSMPDYWPEAVASSLIVAFYLLYVHPEWKTERKRYRLTVEGIHGQLKDPTYFRLTPYEATEATKFKRPDGAIDLVLRWITAAS